MTDYEYDNLPTGEMEMVDALPDDLFPSALAIFNNIIAKQADMAREVKVAHVYDRKGYLTLDSLGGSRNASYGNDDDDLILQVTVRVQHPSVLGMHSPAGLLELENEVTGRRDEAERQKLEKDLADAEEAAAKAAAAVAAHKARLEKHKKGGK